MTEKFISVLVRAGEQKGNPDFLLISDLGIRVTECPVVQSGSTGVIDFLVHYLLVVRPYLKSPLGNLGVEGQAIMPLLRFQVVRPLCIVAPTLPTDRPYECVIVILRVTRNNKVTRQQEDARNL